MGGYLDKSWANYRGILIPGGKGKGGLITPGQGGQNPGKGGTGGNSGNNGNNKDPNFSSVVLLLHMEGANNGTTFTDNSSYAHSPNQSSMTTVTAQKVFGSTSALGGQAPGSGLLYLDAAEYTLGTSDFTIECWFYNTTSLTSNSFLAGQANATPGDVAWFLERLAANNKILVNVRDPADADIGTITSTTVFAANTWYYIRLRRIGSTFDLYSGTTPGGALTLEGSASSASSVKNSAGGLGIGRLGAVTTAANAWPGYIDDFRFTVGVGRTNSTAPAVAFPDSA